MLAQDDNEAAKVIDTRSHQCFPEFTLCPINSAEKSVRRVGRFDLSDKRWVLKIPKLLPALLVRSRRGADGIHRHARALGTFRLASPQHEGQVIKEQIEQDGRDQASADRTIEYGLQVARP
jgi:hypothetical protein